MNTKTLNRPVIRNLACFLPVLLAAQAVADKRTDVELARLKGPVESVRVEESVYTVQFARHVPGPRIVQTVTHYNEQGYKTEFTKYNTDGTISIKKTYRYEEPHRLVEERAFDSEGTLTEQTFHSYDSLGRRIVTSRYDANGVLQQKTIFRYDQGDRLVRSLATEPDGGFISEQVFTYDENDRLTETITRIDGSSLGETLHCTYDSRGRLVRYARHDSNDDLLVVTTYSYDDNNNGVTVHEGTTGKTTVSNYDQNGDIVKKSVVGADKPILYEYGYDWEGNWTQKKTLEWYRQRGHGAHPYYAPTKIEYRAIRYYH